MAAPRFREALLDYGVDVFGGDEAAVVESLRRPSIAGAVMPPLTNGNDAPTTGGRKTAWADWRSPWTRTPGDSFRGCGR